MVSEAMGTHKLRLFPLQNENGLFGKTKTKYYIWKKMKIFFLGTVARKSM